MTARFARPTSRRKTLVFCLFALAALFVAAWSAGAARADVYEAPAPWIASDKSDYAPGEQVTLTGGAWQPGESVHINVNDDQTRSWERDIDVVADDAGNISNSFNLPDWFVATYQVTATGDVSGTARASFTDAIATTTTLTSDPNPSDIGQPVTLIATVTCSQNCTFDNNHSVEFKEGAGANCNNSGTVLGTAAGSSFTGSGLSRTATFNYAAGFSSSGTKSLIACFSGGGSNPRAGASNSGLVPHEVNPGAPAKLGFVQQPSASIVDNAISPAVQVAVQDASGTTVTSSTATVTIALGANPGAATLSGTKSVEAVDGVATFSDLSLNAGASGYTLAASSAPLTGATSSAFNVSKRSTSTALSCSPSPVGITAPGNTSTCTATVTDTAAGNASTPTGTVSLTASTGGSSFSPTSCTLAASTGSSATCTSTLTVTTTGNKTVSASYGGDVKHLNSGSGNQTVAANNLPNTTLTVASASGTFGGTASLSATLKNASTNAAISGKTITFRLNGNSAGTATTNTSGVATLSNASLSGIAVGTYANGVAATFAGDGSANASTGSNTLTVNPSCSTPSVTTDPNNVSITYGGNASFTAAATGNPAPTVQWQVKVGSGNFTDIAGETSTTLALTTPAVSASGNQYRAVFTNNCGGTQTATSSAATLTVNPKLVTVSADAKSKVYGSADPGLTYQVTSGSLEAGDGFSGALMRSAGESVAGSPYAIEQGTLTAGSNYNITFVGADFAITKKSASVSAVADSKVYGSADPAFATTNSGFLAGDLGAGKIVFSASRAAGESVAGSPYAITPSASDGSSGLLANYDVTYNTANFAITKKQLTGSFSVSDKEYDGNTSASIVASSRQLTGVVNDDTLTLSDGSATFVSKNVGTHAVSGTGFTLGGADAGNYSLGAVTAPDGKITAKELKVSFEAQNKVYDGGTTATIKASPAPSLVGVVSGDDVTLGTSTASASFANKNVGTGKEVTASGFTKSGGDAGNYVFASPQGKASADITARELTVTATGVSKTYDGSAGASVTLSTDKVSGDAVTAAYTSASFDNKNVGTGKTVTVTGISISGGDAGNYDLVNTTATTSAGIAKRDLTVSATGGDKVYDGNADTTVTLSTNKVNGDAVTAGYTSASFANANAGTGKTVTVSGISISGSDAGNYNLTNTTATTTAKIDPRPITVTADAKSKLYGDPDPALTWRVTAGNLVDNDAITGVLTRDAGEAVGTYAIKQGTLTAGSNYNLTYVGASLTVGAWTAKGFYAPIGEANSFVVAPGGAAPAPSEATAWQTAKGGSTIPLKFSLYAGSSEKTSTADVKSFTSTKLSSCSATAVNDLIEELVNAGSSSLRYEATDHQFIQNWKTSSVSSDTCYRVALTANDGTSIHTFVKLRK